MIEKEKKFKVIGNLIGPILQIKQTYLLLSRTSHLRVRIIGQKAWLTFKQGTTQIRNEFEWEIPLKDGIELAQSTKVSLSKKRVSETYNWCHVDVDDYGDGKIVGEVEYNEVLSKPDYLGDELDNDAYAKYSNIRIAQENNSTGLSLSRHESVHNLIEFNEYKIMEIIHNIFINTTRTAIIGEEKQIRQIIENTPFLYLITIHVNSVMPVWKIKYRSHYLTFSFIHEYALLGESFDYIVAIGYSNWSEENKLIWGDRVRPSNVVSSNILYIEY